MFLIPAIDIRDGRCVRLSQGEMDSAKVYYRDPLDAAKFLLDRGADLLHVVDLDAALSGHPVNHKIVGKIALLPGVRVQVGGGIRNEQIVEELLSLGVWRVVVGTTALHETERVSRWIEDHPGRICVGIDARDGLVAVKGWTETTEISALKLAARFDTAKIAAIIHTDIARDGMGTGCNINATRALARSVGVPVIASGGIRDLEDVRAVAAAPEDNIVGVIAGRAIYEGTLDLAAALRIRKEKR